MDEHVGRNGRGALTGDVEVGRVEVLAGRGPLGLAVLEAVDAAGPGLVSPWEDEETEFLDDVGI